MFLLPIILFAKYLSDTTLIYPPYNLNPVQPLVIDTQTNLMWQDDTTVQTLLLTWDEALTTCSGLAIGGFSDWRLPNLNELYSLTDKTTFNPAIANIFVYKPATYFWSSTTYAEDNTSAWYVNFYLGRDNAFSKTNKYNVRCVRGPE